MRRRRRSLGAVSTVVVVLLFLLLSLLSSSARALKTKKNVVSSKSSSSSSSSGEEDDRHLLDPALNTDEVRAAASTIGHIEDMDAYLAAIEHKMDVLQDHPAHNVRVMLFIIVLVFVSRFRCARALPQRRHANRGLL
jgi:hypothetical protein